MLVFDTLGTLTSPEALDGAGTVRARPDLHRLSYADTFRVRALGNHGVLKLPEGHPVLAWWGEEPGF